MLVDANSVEFLITEINAASKLVSKEKKENKIRHSNSINSTQYVQKDLIEFFVHPGAKMNIVKSNFTPFHFVKRLKLFGHMR